MTKSEETDALEMLDGVARIAMRRVQHATIEIGPSPDDLWAFRLTIHPFSSKKAAERGVVKMKRLLKTVGITFPEDKDQ